MYVTYTKLLLAVSVIGFSFKLSLELRKCAESGQLEFADPAFGDLVDRHGIDEVHLFSPLPFPGHEIGLLENRQMLRDRLAGHAQPLAQLAQRLAIPAVQPLPQPPAARIGQSAKHSIVIHAGQYGTIWLPNVGNLLVACQAERRSCSRRRRGQAAVEAAVFAMGSCNRLRSSILIAWSVARLAEPAFQRAGDPILRTVAVSCPAFNTPGWPVMRWSGSSRLSAPMFRGALRDTGSEPARRRFPRRERDPLCASFL